VSEQPTPWLNHIIHGDARDMAVVPDAAVQLVVTSPPYNVAKEYSDHNDSLCLDEYVSLLNAVWRECYRVLAPGGRLCVNVANTDRKPYLSLVSLIDEQLRTSGQSWLHRGHIIWDKGASAGISTACSTRTRRTSFWSSSPTASSCKKGFFPENRGEGSGFPRVDTHSRISL